MPSSLSEVISSYKVSKSPENNFFMLEDDDDDKPHQECAVVGIYGMGLVSDVFNELKLDQLPRDMAICRVRYSTVVDRHLIAILKARPFLGLGRLAISLRGLILWCFDRG
ncbi:Amidophosphoribosyltransferase [Abeliophyllum distichum]|uniref:Amidophosphoribosyltransferase n=1 Tax=Abeliophyllum distichum TaxID=126358 RepID=A0ABD1TZK0_9LAMI